MNMLDSYGFFKETVIFEGPLETYPIECNYLDTDAEFKVVHLDTELSVLMYATATHPELPNEKVFTRLRVRGIMLTDGEVPYLGDQGNFDYQNQQPPHIGGFMNYWQEARTWVSPEWTALKQELMEVAADNFRYIVDLHKDEIIKLWKQQVVAREEERLYNAARIVSNQFLEVERVKALKLGW